MAFEKAIETHSSGLARSRMKRVKSALALSGVCSRYRLLNYTPEIVDILLRDVLGFKMEKVLDLGLKTTSHHPKKARSSRHSPKAQFPTSPQQPVPGLFRAMKRSVDESLEASDNKFQSRRRLSEVPTLSGILKGRRRDGRTTLSSFLVKSPLREPSSVLYKDYYKTSSKDSPRLKPSGKLYFPTQDPNVKPKRWMHCLNHKVMDYVRSFPLHQRRAIRRWIVEGAEGVRIREASKERKNRSRFIFVYRRPMDWELSEESREILASIIPGLPPLNPTALLKGLLETLDLSFPATS